ncbi:3-mercaptopyruvate sulfurtransferase [Consotaella salsifontis]|uniref:Sulfurtransferase n=1 Tax=Consotaella salsifontis TaxID=1365950 RepID=A0A1T4TCE6_9HYPH|nr:3-mercaptopyruvate sulfurtransferase [Consotaella salsifontis]SKA38011.1 thiosulfate/3-mercaptopyruvate sulfurtransferase [Consotaella salsifontis]
MTAKPSIVVDCDWLKANLSAPDLIVLDASWYMPAENRDPAAEFEQAHIPGARRFDYDRDIADLSSPLPHMMPSPAVFEERVRALGINGNSQIVVYDGSGIFAAPRAWWMFKAMGHERVCVLDGGLPAWRAAGGEIESGAPRPAEPGNFQARPVHSRLYDASSVLDGLKASVIQVVDARSAPRFEGAQAEPRPGLRSGHMPGARNLPFDRILADGRFRKAEDVRRAFEDAGLHSGQPIVASCGSGVTASVLALGAELAGLGPVAVYDGSWAEWGQETRDDLPVVTGAAG